MKVSHDEGLASHVGSESCVVIREDTGEALTGESAGWVLSSEILNVRDADAVMSRGRQHRSVRQREDRPGPAESKTPGTHRSNSRGSREIPGSAWVSNSSPRREPKGHDGDARTREVGQAHSTCEVSEQGWWCATGCGGDGGKGPGQGEAASANQAHGTQSPVPQGGPATRAGAATIGGLPPVRLIQGKSPVR